MPSFAAFLCDPFGTRLADASNFVECQYTLAVSAVGVLTLTLPGTFDPRLIRIPDGRIELWRKLSNGRETLEGEAPWLIKRVGYKRDGRGLKTYVVRALSPLCLLRDPGRFVNYKSGSAQTQSSGPADDEIKAVVRENLGGLATDSARDLSALLTVQANASLGATVTKAYAWRDVLKVCQEIAQDSAEQGTYIAFDMVAPESGQFEFRTYAGQRGVDRRSPDGVAPILLSPDMGNVGESELTIDYENEITYALAGGQEQGSARQTQSAQDNARLALSPFGLRETFVQASNVSSTQLTSEANAAVRNGRPRLSYKAKLLSTSSTRYGEQWGFGDYVTVQDYGQSFDCRADAVSVSIKGASDEIDAWIRFDGVLS